MSKTTPVGRIVARIVIELLAAVASITLFVLVLSMVEKI